MVICDEKPSASRAQILEKIKGVDAVYWSTKVKLDKEVIDTAGRNEHFQNDRFWFY